MLFSCIPGLALVEVKEFAQVELLGTLFESFALGDDARFARLDFVHFVEALLFLLLSLEWLKDLEAAQLFITLDGFDEDQAPFLELSRGREANFDVRHFVGGRDLDKEVAIVATATADLSVSEIDEPAGFSLTSVFLVSEDALFDRSVPRHPVCLALESDLATDRKSLKRLIRIN